MDITEAALIARATRDRDARLVYADWLEDIGRVEASDYVRHGGISEEEEREASKVLHSALVACQLEELDAEASAAYKERRVSDGYWANRRFALLSRVGYVRVEIGANLRYKAEPGVILVRPSTGGKWGKSRKEKSGRPLTAFEMLSLLEAPKKED